MIRRERVGHDHHFMFMDVEDILPSFQKNIDWMKKQGREHSLSILDFERKVSLGDESYVERSNEFLASIGDQMPVSRGWRNVDDVVGAVPNVPAFLAGHPQHMRRRERVARDSAPLTVYMDLTSSFSIHRDKVLRRGIVLLALVRMLVEHRAVELWAGSTLLDRNSATTAWKIDTVPLDLARAAFHVADPVMSRVFAYGVCRMQANERLIGTLNQNEEKEQRLRMASGWDEILYIPGIHVYDPMTDDPVGWLRRVMAQYVPSDD